MPGANLMSTGGNTIRQFGNEFRRFFALQKQIAIVATARLTYDKGLGCKCGGNPKQIECMKSMRVNAPYKRVHTSCTELGHGTLDPLREARDSMFFAMWRSKA